MGKGQNMDWGLSRAVEADSFDQSAPDYVTQWAEKLGRRQIQLIRPTTTVGRKQLMDGRPAQRFRWSRWAQKLGMSLTLLAFIPFLLSILTVNFFPALSSLIFFSTILVFHFLHVILPHLLSSSATLCPIWNPFFLPVFIFPLTSSVPVTFLSFFLAPGMGRHFPLFSRCMPTVLGILLNYLLICSKSCSKISVDSLSILLYFSGCY